MGAGSEGNGHDSLPLKRREGDRVRPARGSLGRRKNDFDPRITFSRKFLVIAVAVVDLTFQISEALLFGHNVCP
jgi:hypothetical protein